MDAARDIRGEIYPRNVDPVQEGADLMEAVERRDVDFVAAVEGAPMKFQLTIRDWIEKSREARVAASPLRPRYESEAHDAAQLEGVVGEVRAVVGRLAERHGLRDEWVALVNQEGRAMTREELGAWAEGAEGPGYRSAPRTSAPTTLALTPSANGRTSRRQMIQPSASPVLKPRLHPDRYERGLAISLKQL